MQIYIYIYMYNLLIRHRLYVAWTGGSVIEFQLLHTVVVGSISNGGDHSVHCWWDLIRSKQLFSVPYVICRCLPDFLVMVILTYIYIYIYIYPIIIIIKASWQADSFLPSVPINQSFYFVLKIASSICTELINESFCWLANTCVYMSRSP